MAGRLALLICSQCQKMAPLSFLPAQRTSKTDLAALPEEQRLIAELYALMIKGPGGADPVEGIDGADPPGLLINPTMAQADAALVKAMRQAHDAEAMLIMFYA